MVATKTGARQAHVATGARDSKDCEATSGATMQSVKRSGAQPGITELSGRETGRR